MKKIGIILLLLLLGIIFFITFIFTKNKQLYFSLNGMSSIEVNIGEEYIEDGFNAKYCSKYLKIFCNDINDYVEISKREVDNNRYFLNYILNYKNMNKVLTREIVYVDKESPVIEIMDAKNSYCPKDEHNEEIYSAYDNVDGDITDKVLKKIIDDKIYYSVSDSSGNKRVVYRELTYNDIEAPVIDLNGGDVNYVFLNEEYNEKGFNVIDNCDIDLSDKVEVNSNLDTKTVGEYEIIYNVSDSANNIGSAKRKVIVYKDISDVLKNGKKVYLTFDDGPGSYTDEILNILDKYNVKATFFVTNQFSNYQNLIKREYESGHTVAVHTYTHNYKNIYSSFDNYINDFNQMNQIIYEQTGIYSKIFRFPGGSSNTISKFNRGIMTEIVTKMNELGYYYFDWNVDSIDTSEKEPNKIFQNVKNGIKEQDHSVVLMHDIKKANIESVEKIISYGLENGYTFLPLDETSPIIHHSVNN